MLFSHLCASLVALMASMDACLYHAVPCADDSYRSQRVRRMNEQSRSNASTHQLLAVQLVCLLVCLTVAAIFSNPLWKVSRQSMIGAGFIERVGGEIHKQNRLINHETSFEPPQRPEQIIDKIVRVL